MGDTCLIPDKIERLTSYIKYICIEFYEKHEAKTEFKTSFLFFEDSYVELHNKNIFFFIFNYNYEFLYY